ADSPACPFNRHHLALPGAAFTPGPAATAGYPSRVTGQPGPSHSLARRGARTETDRETTLSRAAATAKRAAGSPRTRRQALDAVGPPAPGHGQPPVHQE